MHVPSRLKGTKRNTKIVSGKCVIVFVLHCILLSLFLSFHSISNVLKESEKTAALDEEMRKAMDEKEKVLIDEATAASLAQEKQSVMSLLDSSPDDEADLKPAAAVRNITITKSIQVASRKRSMDEVQEETKQRVVSQLLEIAHAEGVTPMHPWRLLKCSARTTRMLIS
jgi:hypothetical protein